MPFINGFRITNNDDLYKCIEIANLDFTPRFINFCAESYVKITPKRSVNINIGIHVDDNQGDNYGYIHEIYIKKSKKNTLVVAEILVNGKNHYIILANESGFDNNMLEIKRMVSRNEFDKININPKFKIQISEYKCII